jgi:uncharacterized Zn-binding protein involved in type VI secretion
MLTAVPVFLALVLAAVAPPAPRAGSALAPAARQGDPTSHGGTITQGSPNVFIGGRPAARQGDFASCPQVQPGNPPTPHVGGPITGGSATVLINGRRAARTGDAVTEAAGAGSTVQAAQGTVLIN